ncbi:MAG TPA: MFS transporter, partial [Candidatus Kryptonia bacterium]|nr:MFS transporter [Candidatus Kryptonia bacterium]
VWALTLLGGVLADRADRRRIIVWFQSIQMLCPALIVVLLVAGAVRPWMIVSLSVVVGVTDALSMPSFQSIVPSIVEYEQIGAGIALNSTQLNLSRILGPAIGGVLMLRTGALSCFVLSALSYIPFILVALWILPRRDAAREISTGMNDRQNLFAGTREIVRESDLRGALLTVLVSSALCGPLITFCPVLVKNVFHADASDFGAVLAVFGVGGIVGATSLLAVEGRKSRRRLCSLFAVLYGLIVIATALNPSFIVLACLLAFGGGAMTVSNASANTLLQRTAGPRLRGETASLFMLAIRGGRSVGDMATGLSVSALGIRWALLLNGVLAVLIQLSLARTWEVRVRSTVSSQG